MRDEERFNRAAVWHAERVFSARSTQEKGEIAWSAFP